MVNRYSFTEFIKTAYSLAVTKFTMPQARLIRHPVYIRGGKSVAGGKRLTMGRFCRFDLNGSRQTLFIGDDCEFGDMTHIAAYERIEIGHHVLLASKCFISDTSHGDYKGMIQSRPDEPPGKRKLVTAPVKIGNSVWIGENAVVLAGAVIGDGCIIGANSVVCSNIPSGCIAAGVPAKVIKKYDRKTKTWNKINEK